MAFALVLAVGLLYVRLLQGPIPLTFLTSQIEQGINSEFTGVGVRIEDVGVRLAESGHIEFELRNVRVADAAGAPLAFAPSAAVSLSRRALLTGRIAPESVDLISPRLVLFYSEDGTLSLKFSPPGDQADNAHDKLPPLRGSTDAVPSDAATADAAWSLGRIDLIKVLSEASARARRRERASAYLREIGLKSATVIIDNGTRKSIWRVRDLAIDLDHKRSRSSIAGRAKIESLTGPWEINFRTMEAESTKKLQLAVSVQGLVPKGLARTLPQLAGLESVDVPIWGEAQIDLSNTGEILGGTIGIDAAPGRLSLPWLAKAPLRIDGGHLAMSYSSATRRFEIAPSVLVWGDSRVQFTGAVTHVVRGPEGPGWNFDLRSAGGWLGAEPPFHQRLVIDDWLARGFLAPERGRIVLDQFTVRAGGAEVSAQGDVADMAGAMRARLDGKIGPMPAEVFKALWPSALAPKTHEWVAKHLVRGRIQGGAFKLASGAPAQGAEPGAADRVSLTLEGSDLALGIAERLPAVEIPRALLRLDGQLLEITAPEASMGTPDGRRMALKGNFTVDMKEPLPRTGHLSVKGQGPLSLVLEMLDREAVHVLQDSGLTVASVDGKVDAQLTLSMPLDHALLPHDVKVEGKARIIDGRVKQAIGPHDIHGANIAIDMTSTAVEAKGEMLVNGVLAKASWQHVFGAAPEKQPPLRLTASLDNSDRTQLGMDINDLVQGEVGMEVVIFRDARNERRVHARADLVNAEVILESVAWRKPRGRPSLFEFDVVKGTTHPTELLNVKLVGDNVAVEGWMGVGADHKVKEFRFPSFSLNVVGSLEARGKLRPDNVWEVTAKGATYDGRDVFRSFFDVAQVPDPAAKNKPGLDLRAEIDNVIGFSDTTLRQVRLTLHKRANRVVGLDVRGVLEGNKAFAAVIRNESGQPRRLLADATDAGQLFKLVGFYPNAIGGAMNLEVNLDGQGPAERTGTLWARNFSVLGDPVVSEVLQNAEGGQQGGQRKAVVREKFDFEHMRIPFSVGHGQFVMHSAYINGPLVGATMRGKVDFRSQTLNVGGTYVPLSGLNRALAPIPLLGPLLTGPRGEGVLGITFAIQGAMANPQVIVNPLSLITPGIFREIMQMTPEDPRVLPRERAPPARGDSGARSSSSPVAAPLPSASAEPRMAPDIAGGWSAETNQGGTTKKK
ncbi:MAG: hypothetical protein F9K29_05115 [Hyphomicrobiaceae bacterium]|nr:MAG: hypothetical protein F9K29_05115 [Hyphomicrobiaceae bacterium]